MAETLTLGIPKKFTLDATAGNVTHVTVPEGAKTLKMSSAAVMFYDASAAADGAAGDATAQFRYEAGTFSDRLPGMGISADTALPTATVYRFAGSAAAQEVWMHAVVEL